MEKLEKFISCAKLIGRRLSPLGVLPEEWLPNPGLTEHGLEEAWAKSFDDLLDGKPENFQKMVEKKYPFLDGNRRIGVGDGIKTKMGKAIKMAAQGKGAWKGRLIELASILARTEPRNGWEKGVWSAEPGLICGDISSPHYDFSQERGRLGGEALEASRLLNRAGLTGKPEVFERIGERIGEKAKRDGDNPTTPTGVGSLFPKNIGSLMESLLIEGMTEPDDDSEKPGREMEWFLRGLLEGLDKDDHLTIWATTLAERFKEARISPEKVRDKHLKILGEAGWEEAHSMLEERVFREESLAGKSKRTRKGL